MNESYTPDRLFSDTWWELKEKRHGDLAQRYEGDQGGTMWLTSYTRADNVEVGDKGRMVYRTVPNVSSLYYFIKESPK